MDVVVRSYGGGDVLRNESECSDGTTGKRMGSALRVGSICVDKVVEALQEKGAGD